MVSIDVLREVLGALCLACAFVGVFESYIAARNARVGEVPDLGGRSFLGGAVAGYHERSITYYINLRAHFRRSADELNRFSSTSLLVSVVAGLGINFVQIEWAISALIFLSAITLAIAIVFFTAHRTASSRRVSSLQQEREGIERDFSTERRLHDPKNFMKYVHSLKR